MRYQDILPFSAGLLDRAADLRADAQSLAQTAGQIIPFWRGKALIQGETLVRVGRDHPIMAEAAADLILLGRSDGAPIFAADISAWTPGDDDVSSVGAFRDLTRQHHPSMAEDQLFVELRTIMPVLSPADGELAATALAIQNWHRTHEFCAACGVKSQFAMGGWQRDCADCGAMHYPRTDPVVIMLITRGNDTLIGRSPGWPEGMYSTLAGFVEPGETFEAAVRREVFEETKIRVGDVKYVAAQPWPFPMSLMIGCHGEAETWDITVDPNEIDDARWLSREELASVIAGQHPTILPARRGSIAHFLLENWLADRLE